MKAMIRLLKALVRRLRAPSIEEQYLAQSVDAQDFEVRLQALEFGRR